MSDFTCHVGEELGELTRKDYREACKRLDFYAEYNGNRYCVLHYPSAKNVEEFVEAARGKLRGGNFDFRGCCFPKGGSRFRDFVFTGEALFSSATFEGEAAFDGATFKEKADFSDVTFTGWAWFFWV